MRRALTIGFTLDELAQFFRQRAAGSPPCRKVRALASKKLEELDRQIAMLQSMRGSLARTLETWDARLEATPPNGFAFLFDELL